MNKDYIVKISNVTLFRKFDFSISMKLSRTCNLSQVVKNFTLDKHNRSLLCLNMLRATKYWLEIFLHLVAYGCLCRKMLLAESI